MSAAVIITLAGDAVIAFDYDPAVVSRLKAEIPPPYRSWQPERKTWRIEAPFVSHALSILRTAFATVHIDDVREASRSAPRSSGPPDAYTVLHLQPTAPRELVDAAYKCLARLHHPDRGGDTEAMQAINQAYQEVAS